MLHKLSFNIHTNSLGTQNLLQFSKWRTIRLAEGMGAMWLTRCMSQCEPLCLVSAVFIRAFQPHSKAALYFLQKSNYEIYIFTTAKSDDDRRSYNIDEC